MKIDRTDVLLVLSVFVIAAGLLLINPALLIVAVGWVGLTVAGRTA